ncbi:MAG TPA: polysaccharide biosynthesis/export family protein [Thermoanaerobaculia bacterium]|jgi:polysaccharide export outer membrane protein|nr:polysaccharide biosynthesis/export family protein [Thermoanaerobaculia bacterium]
MFKAVWLGFGALLLVAALGSAQGAAPSGATAGYRIGPKDLVEVRVVELQELNVERRVSEKGMINLPFLEDIQAAGLTDSELAARLKTELERRLLQRATVSVQVREFRARPISVIGAVQTPGPLEFAGRWTLLEAITAAGGLTSSHGRMAYILRHADNGLSDQVAIDLDDLLVRADPRVNVPIFPNDLINIPATLEVTVYFLGEVSQPGALTFKSTERITLLSAVARAGGLTDRAGRKIKIRRSDPSGKAQDIEVDYKRIVAGKDPDVPLQEGDVVVVKESFF